MNSISWEAPSFHFIEKSSTWYMWSIVISAVVAGLSLLQGNLMFLFFVILAEAMILLVANQKPSFMVYEADDKRISATGNKEYPYEEISGFAVVEDQFNERYHELILLPSSRISTYVKIFVPSERAHDVKVFFEQYLPEVPYKEPISTNILKRIGL